MRGWVERHGRGLWIRGFRVRGEDWRGVKERPANVETFTPTVILLVHRFTVQERGHCRNGVCIHVQYCMGRRRLRGQRRRSLRICDVGYNTGHTSVHSLPFFFQGSFLVQTFYLTAQTIKVPVPKAPKIPPLETCYFTREIGAHRVSSRK